MADRIHDKLRGREVLNPEKAKAAASASMRVNVFDRIGPKLKGVTFFEAKKYAIIWVVVVLLVGGVLFRIGIK